MYYSSLHIIEHHLIYLTNMIKWNEVISIFFIEKKHIIYFASLLIGVILSVFSVIKLNHTYANARSNLDYDVSTMVPFYWMILIIGGLILITLSYVSWRKYKGTIKRKKNREAND